MTLINMRLPFQLPFLKKEKKEYFLSIVIRSEKVSAVIFEEVAEKVRIVSEQEENFKDSIETASIEELLEIFDDVISKAESKLPSPLETPKTIFGVKENWILQSRIKKEYLVKLKKISDTLGINPIGFIVIPEAIAHLLRKEEGAPVSAILVEIGRTRLSLSLIRAGKIIEIKETPIKDSIAQTTDILLHHFTEYEVLPSRILLFNTGKDDLVQEFIGHTWSKKLPFLHVPQVQTLPKGFDARAVLFGAATQMGFELLQEEETKTITLESSSKGVVYQQTKTQIKDGGVEKTLGKEEIISDNFGFVKEVDVASIHKEKLLSKDSSSLIENEVIEVEIEKPLEKEFYRGKNFEKPKDKFLIPKQIFNYFSRLFSLLPLQNLRHLFIKVISRKRKKILFVPPVIIASILIIFIIYILNVKAIVNLKLNPKVTEENQKVKLTIDEPSDFSRNIISLKTISVSENGTATTLATGTKEIGEKAKGSVTIYNSELKSGKNLQKGWAITSSNNLAFTLDSSVSLASASGDASAITPSTQKVSVIASDIGKEFNLPSGTKFNVESFDASTVIAKNENAFSGGSKKEITVVSKKDRESLLAKITKDLSLKAKDEISQKIPDNELLLPIELKSNIDKTEFDHNSGDETKSVTVKATIMYDGYVYSKDDLERFSKSLIKDKFRSMTIARNGISSSFTDVKQDNQTINTVLHLKALLLPQLNTQNLTEQIAGISFEEAKGILSKLPQVERIDIDLHPSLPFMPQMLPRFTKNITVTVNTNE